MCCEALIFAPEYFILLLPFHLQTPNINFWIGLEESFQKIYTFTVFLFIVSDIELFQ